ncbi:MAG TPA: BamA/TamA family outer membrane protein, partial [Acidobacteriota bacterium]|nr:BamA/TamA family outer membrane protein [Acidobacteriota bacterium]
FYGVGNDSSKEDKTRFGYFPTSFDFAAAYHPVRFVTAGGSAEYLQTSSDGPGKLADVTPGAGTDPLYIVPGAFASFDWRQGPGYSNSGGLYRAEWRMYKQHGEGDLYSFHWFEGEVSQFIPILRANQVIALDALTTISDTDADKIVPFYMMPRLGGSHYLRGFPSSRFRDRDRLYLSAEYRWTPSKFLDVALYYEAGKVASRTADLDFTDLHDDFGIGFRFHSPKATMLRIEVAHSNEATRFIFTVGPAF